MKLEAIILCMLRLLVVGAPQSILVGLSRGISLVLPLSWIIRFISSPSAPFLDVMVEPSVAYDSSITSLLVSSARMMQKPH